MFKNMQDILSDSSEQNPNVTESHVNNRILENLAFALTDHEGWETHHWYIDITGGTVISLPSEFQMMCTGEDAYTSQWQKDNFKLLNMYEKHEKIMINPVPSYISFRVMEDFASSCEPRHQTVLLNALEKKHPFARFRQSVERMGILEKWYEFKNKAENQIAERWLEDNDLAIQNGKIVRISK